MEEKVGYNKNMDTNKTAVLIGTCQDEELVKSIFGSVSEFARLIEERGESFTYRSKYRVRYNEEEDIHYFYELV